MKPEKSLRIVQERLGEHGQWVAVDGDPQVAVGSLVEENSTGPYPCSNEGRHSLASGI